MLASSSSPFVARAWVRWAPRALAFVYAAFISLFALDVFEGEASVGTRLIALAIHLLPTALFAALITLAWRREWVGALGCVGLALFYAWSARVHLDWIAVSLPLVLLALLYALAWRQRRREPRPAAS